MLRVPLLLLALVFGMPAAEATQGRPIRIGSSGNFFIRWTPMPAAPPHGEQVVGVGEYLFKQPLWPSGVAKMNTDVRDATGAVVIAAGSVLFKVERLWTIYCQIDTAVTKVESRAVCLSDANDKGSFDRLFYHRTQPGFLPAVRDSIPSKIETIEPVAYSVLKPGQWDSPFSIGVKFLGAKGFPSKGPLFDFVLGPSAEIRLASYIQVKKHETPTLAERDGARVNVRTWDKTRLQATVESVYSTEKTISFGSLSTIIYAPPVR